MARKKTVKVVEENFDLGSIAERGALYTRVQGFIYLVLGLVGLKLLLPFIGINITLEGLRTFGFFALITGGILFSLTVLGRGLARLITGQVED